MVRKKKTKTRAKVSRSGPARKKKKTATRAKAATGVRKKKKATRGAPRKKTAGRKVTKVAKKKKKTRGAVSTKKKTRGKKKAATKKKATTKKKGTTKKRATQKKRGRVAKSPTKSRRGRPPGKKAKKTSTALGFAESPRTGRRPGRPRKRPIEDIDHPVDTGLLDHDDADQANSDEGADSESEEEEEEGGQEAPSAEPGQVPSPGQKALDFKLKDESGELVSLRDFRGKYVVLYFYPKDDTPGCSNEALAFRDYYAALVARNVVVLGVSGDDEESHCAFIEKFDLPFQLLVDEDHSLADRYGVWVERNMYGRKYMGIQRSTFLIDPKGIILKVWPRVNVGGHAQEVYQAVPVT